MQVLLTIPLGLTIELLIFFLLNRAIGMAAKGAALIVGLLALAIYVPYAIIVWPGADIVALHVAIYLVAAYALGLIMGYREVESGGGSFHWAPTLIVAFFVVLVLFDSVLVVVATRGLPKPVADWLLPKTATQHEVSSAFPGVVEHDYQKKESQYNAYLQQVEDQNRRGWVVHKGWLGPVRAGRPGVFQVTVADRNGAPVTAAEIEGGFLRPSDTRLDHRFALAETAPGQYQVELTLPVPGVWDLVLEIRHGDDLHRMQATTSIGD